MDPGSKTVERLKNEQTSAKRSFTRLANSIIRTHDSISEDQLLDSFSKITIEGEKVMEANDGVLAGVLAEEEAKLKKGDEVNLTKQQQADLSKTQIECDLKLKEVGELIGETLWKKFGDELCTAVELAEAEVECVESVHTDGNHEAYEFMLRNLKSQVETAKKAHCKWQQWIPIKDKAAFRHRVKELERRTAQLVTRKAGS